MSTEPSKPKLSFWEWVCLAIVLGFLALLIGISLYTRSVSIA